MPTLTANGTSRVSSLSMEEYKSIPAISKSGLDLINRSPAHFRQDQLYPEPPTPAMAFGAMAHKFLLEPNNFGAEYAVLPDGIDRRTKDGREAWVEWESNNAGKSPVTLETMCELEAMSRSLDSYIRASLALAGGHAEQSFFWQTASEHGLLDCKARIDYVRDQVLVDFKTTTDARSEAFSRACWNLRYHVQAAFYTDSFHAVTGEKADGFLFVAMEKSPPYAVAVYQADETMIEQGRAEYLRNLETYAECLNKDKWPAYPDVVQGILLPVWAREEEYR